MRNRGVLAYWRTTALFSSALVLASGATASCGASNPTHPAADGGPSGDGAPADVTTFDVVYPSDDGRAGDGPVADAVVEAASPEACGATNALDDNGVDTRCSANEGIVVTGVYMSPQGSDLYLGTPDFPVATFTAALARVQANPTLRYVFVAMTSMHAYDSAGLGKLLSLGIGVFGGLDPAQGWTRPMGPATPPAMTAIAGPPQGVHVAGGNGATLRYVLLGDDPARRQAPYLDSLAMFVDGAEGFSFAHVTLAASDGAAGTNGAAGKPGDDDSQQTVGGSARSPLTDAGIGGLGGVAAPPAACGSPALGPSGGDGGAAGGALSAGQPGQPGQDGAPGGSGAGSNGYPGAPGGPGGRSAWTFDPVAVSFATASPSGIQGEMGGGGGGGGGEPNSGVLSGFGGGAGGGGGCGGYPGAGGMSGGFSVALVVRGRLPSFEATTLSTGQAGSGGAGGQGGAGGPGGLGGLGYNNGGQGGAGGAGGPGTGGGGGWAIGLYVLAPAVVDGGLDAGPPADGGDAGTAGDDDAGGADGDVATDAGDAGAASDAATGSADAAAELDAQGSLPTGLTILTRGTPGDGGAGGAPNGIAGSNGQYFDDLRE